MLEKTTSVPHSAWVAPRERGKFVCEFVLRDGLPMLAPELDEKFTLKVPFPPCFS